MSISSTNIERLEPVSLMFQTGYLTMKHKTANLSGTRYQLAYPNEEVRQAFSKGLLEVYAEDNFHETGSFSLELFDALMVQDWTNVFAICNRVLAAVPYEIFPKKEIYFHSLMHLMFVSTGLSIQSQVQTSLGRIDTVVETPEQFMIFEYKIGGTPKATLKQMKQNAYGKSYSGKPVLGVGVVFDLETKSIVDWGIEEI